MNFKRTRKLEPYQKLNILLIIVCLVLVGGLSVGYAILSQTLNIGGTVTLRSNKDIRINSISNFISSNGSYENYNPTYTENSITTNVNLPNLTSTATYTVTIKNNSSVNKDIDTITNALYNNANISYTLNGAQVGTEILAGASLTFTITYKYADGVATLPESTSIGANIDFTFKDHVEVATLLSYARDNQVVTSGDGLYNTTTDTYIYKGGNVNNYLKFSGNDTIYRIIGFLPDGTLKLISTDFSNQMAYDVGGNRAVATSPYCTNAASNGCNYFGTTTASSLTYTNNLAVATDSSIKVWLDNWYSTLASDIKSKIVLHDFNGGFVNYNQTPVNMVSQTPNIIYTTYVALPGVDDFFNSFVTMPTANINTTYSSFGSNNTYLLSIENNTQEYWLLNASTYDNWDIWAILSGTTFGQRKASRTSQNSVSYHVLPSFYLLSNQTFTGTGTSTDPFII